MDPSSSAIGTSSRSFSFKVVLLGEGCVGKTSVVLRYVEDRFDDKHVTTLQVMYSFLCSGPHGLHIFKTVSFYFTVVHLHF